MSASSITSERIAVRCRGVSKEFGTTDVRIRVLQGIDLDVPEGELTFIVGPSGCGKTTLISIIAGILTPGEGAIDVFGTPIQRLSARDLSCFRMEKIGFIFQQYNLMPALTAVENASVPLLVRGERENRARQKASALLDELGLGRHLHKFANELSGGQQQRVAIARALVHEPRLVICDEPTASLDAASGQTVMHLLRDIAIKPDRAVIVVTHDDRIFDYADRIAHMNDGRLDALTHVDRKDAA